MKTRKYIRFSVAVAAFLMAIDCASHQSVAPETIPSTSSIGYAIEWSDHLKSITQEYRDGAQKVRSTSKELSSYPDKLADPDWNQVHLIIKTANDAGKSQAVVDFLRSERQLKAFLSRHEKELSFRLGSHAQATLSKVGCDCHSDMNPISPYALDDTFDRSIKKRFHEVNEALRILDKSSNVLKAEDKNILEEQVIAITAASYFVYVGSVDIKNEINRLLLEAEDISSTLDKAISEEDSVSKNTDLPRKRTKIAHENLKLFRKAKAPMDRVVEDAKTLQTHIEEEATTLQTIFEKAIDRLIELIEVKQKAAWTVQ